MISGLSLTKKWKECFKLLETLKLTSRPASIVYSSIAQAAFLNQEEALGWNILEKSLSKMSFT